MKFKFLNLKWVGLFFLVIISMDSCNYSENDLQNKLNAPKYYASLSPRKMTEGDYTDCIKQYDSVYFNIKNPNAWDKQYYYNAHSWMSEAISQHDAALRYADSSIEALRQITDKALVAEYHSGALLSKGMILIKTGHYNEAYKNFFEAKQVLDLIKDSCSKMQPIDYYGMVLYRQKEYELAKNAFVEELYLIKNCYEKLNIPYSGKQQVLDNIGLCFTKLNQFDSAKKYYLQAIDAIEKTKSANFNNDITEQIRFKLNLGVISGNLAKVYIDSKPDSAIYYYKKAITLNASGTSELGDAQLCMFQLANVQLQQKLYKDAFETLTHLKLSLDTFKNQSADLGYKECLYKYYAVTNQYQQAFEAHRNFLAVKDSIDKKEIGINTTNINKELKDREQQLQIKVLQKDNSISNLYLIIGSIILLLLISITFLVNKNYKKSKQQNIQLTNLNQQIFSEKTKTEIALQHLDETNKAKDRILNVVAHDLRNPISGIASIAQSIADNDDIKQNKELAKLIEQTSTDSLTLINELLQANKKTVDMLKVSPVSVNYLIEKTIQLLQHKATEKKQIIKMTLLEHDVVLKIDESKIQRVLSNLINNAIKFSYEKTIVSIEVKKSSNSIVMVIEDNGIGIAKEELTLLFTQWNSPLKKQGTSREESYGYGLSICKEIVEAHNGNIWAESEEGKGSSFYISLHLANDI